MSINYNNINFFGINIMWAWLIIIISIKILSIFVCLQLLNLPFLQLFSCLFEIVSFNLTCSISLRSSVASSYIKISTILTLATYSILNLYKLRIKFGTT